MRITGSVWETCGHGDVCELSTGENAPHLIAASMCAQSVHDVQFCACTLLVHQSMLCGVIFTLISERSYIKMVSRDNQPF